MKPAQPLPPPPTPAAPPAAPAPGPDVSPDTSPGASGDVPTFPTAALGPGLEAAAVAAAARTQGPVILAAHHLLTLAAMAAQRLISVRLPTGALRPVSCYVLTLAGAGEGRSALAKAVVAPMRERADDKVARRSGVFATPSSPGTSDRYRRFGAQSALFAEHGKTIVAPGRVRAAEAASLSGLWDGRVENTFIRTAPDHPRFSFHLVAAPRDAQAMLGDADLADGGVLGRLLAAAPASRIGHRQWRAVPTDDPSEELAAFHVRVQALCARESTAHSRAVAFTEAAASQWLAFAQEVEINMREDGAFAAIRPLAGHLAEHAARLAAVIALMEDDGLTALDEAALARGIALARFYAAEALRLTAFASVLGPAPEAAERLHHWLERTHDGRSITLRDVCRLGPAGSRDADVAYRLMRRLERLGFIQPKTSSEENGVTRRVREPYCWVVKPAAANTQVVMSQDVA